MSKNILVVVLPATMYLECYSKVEDQKAFQKRLSSFLPAGETNVSMVAGLDANQVIVTLSVIGSPSMEYVQHFYETVGEIFKGVEDLRIILSSLVASNMK